MNEIELNDERATSKLYISSESNWTLFDKIADALETELRGTWVEKADGFDQRYWDLKIEEEVLTLHLDHYLGILAYSNSKSLLSLARSVIESSIL